MLDDDGYPTDETLKTIREWPHEDGLKELLEFVWDVWWQPDWGWKETEVPREQTTPGTHRLLTNYNISTGGWSGNEDLIEALRGNNIFWLMAWQQSRRGGHYIFELPLTTEEE